jgi:5-methylcytosine-specific restriction endonuclease McrA
VTAHPKPTKATRLETKRRRRELAILRRAELRCDVVIRSRERCEWCGYVPLAEVHHVVHGSGKRAQEERLDTLAALCLDCHGRYHRGDRYTMLLGRAWAKRNGFTRAAEEIQRRLDKLPPLHAALTRSQT